jgi:hypothetical protein
MQSGYCISPQQGSVRTSESCNNHFDYLTQAAVNGALSYMKLSFNAAPNQAIYRMDVLMQKLAPARPPPQLLATDNKVNPVCPSSASLQDLSNMRNHKRNLVNNLMQG